MTFKYIETDPFGNIFSRVYLENIWIVELQHVKLGGYKVRIIADGVNDVSIYTNEITYNPAFSLNGKLIVDLVENLNYKIGDIYGVNITGINCNRDQFSIYFVRLTTADVSETTTNLSPSLFNNKGLYVDNRPIIKFLDNKVNSNKQSSNKGCSGGYCYSNNDFKKKIFNPP